MPGKRTLYNTALVKQTIAPAAQVITTPLNGTAVDRRSTTAVGAQKHRTFRSALVVIETGVVNDGAHTVVIEESDDNSTWNTVAAADLQGAQPTVALTDDNVVKEIGYIGLKRYLRVSWTQVGGTTLTTFRSACVVLGDPTHAPVR